MIRKFALSTLGCRTNQYEVEAYRKQLQQMGFVESSEGEGADVVIVNTCSVTHSADAHSRNAIRKMQKEHPGAKIVVTGCLAEKLQQETFAEDLFVVSNKEKETLLTHLFPGQELPEFSIDYFSAHTRAFVKVQDGCNQFCTYCIIPYVRGRSRSRTKEKIVEEVRSLAANGYKEVVLTGINVGDYSSPDNGDTLASVMKALLPIEGIERIRLSSIDPHQVDEELIQLMGDHPKCCNSMHLVLQSGSNFVLKKMNRGYTRQQFLTVVERLLEKDPDFTFTTDVLVGFPGESEADFADTLEVMRRVCFAKIHVFPYSKRERTRAALFTEHLPERVIHERRAIVNKKAEELAFFFREKFVGRESAVLIENRETNGYFLGHTANFLPVLVPLDGIKQNQMVRVKLLENRAEGLIGTCI